MGNTDYTKATSFTEYFLVTILLSMAMIMSACSRVSSSSADNIPQEPAVSNEVIILATTTSTQDSGLLDVLVPVFEEQTGYFVKVIAVGTGQALEMGSRGDADVLFVHAPDAEKVLIENGEAVNRQLIMHNDFVLVGPDEDPAGIRSASSPAEALDLIASSEALFISRGDDSGTHKRELSLWQQSDQAPGGDWYLESGQGMGATLRIASEKNGYTLTDRATYLALQDTLDSVVLFENDPDLLNIYHAMQMNPDRWLAVNGEGAAAWIEFLISDPTQQMIADFGVAEFGQPLFFPDAGKDESDLLGNE